MAGFARSILECVGEDEPLRLDDFAIPEMLPYVGAVGPRMHSRQVPPKRTSISHENTLKPWGPHQRIKCSGSVQASKTSSRGASKIRVMTSSRSADCVTPSLLVDTSFLLPY